MTPRNPSGAATIMRTGWTTRPAEKSMSARAMAGMRVSYRRTRTTSSALITRCVSCDSCHSSCLPFDPDADGNKPGGPIGDGTVVARFDEEPDGPHNEPHAGARVPSPNGLGARLVRVVGPVEAAAEIWITAGQRVVGQLDVARVEAAAADEIGGDRGRASSVALDEIDDEVERARGHGLVAVGRAVGVEERVARAELGVVEIGLDPDRRLVAEWHGDVAADVPPGVEVVGEGARWHGEAAGDPEMDRAGVKRRGLVPLRLGGPRRGRQGYGAGECAEGGEGKGANVRL